MSDCLFCKIIKGKIPNYTVYEDENTLAFLDINPHAKGHTVVIPKKHFTDLSEMSDVDWQNMAVALKNIQTKLQNILNPDGFNIGINDKEVAGQVVPHVHWHIFPRYEGDGGGSVHSVVPKLDGFDVKNIAKLFK